MVEKKRREEETHECGIEELYPVAPDVVFQETEEVVTQYKGYTIVLVKLPHVPPWYRSYVGGRVVHDFYGSLERLKRHIDQLNPDVAPAVGAEDDILQYYRVPPEAD